MCYLAFGAKNFTSGLLAIELPNSGLAFCELQGPVNAGGRVAIFKKLVFPSSLQKKIVYISIIFTKPQFREIAM